MLRKEKEGLVKQLSALDAESQALATRQERLRQRQKEYPRPLCLSASGVLYIGGGRVILFRFV